MALTDNLVAYWKMEETSGTRYDETANNNDLTDNNTVGSGTGIISTGADFELSNSEWLNISNTAQTGLDFTGDMSFSCWLSVESTSANYILGRWGTPGNWAYRFILNGSNLYLGTSANGSSTTFFQKAWTPTLNQLYHVVFTKSGTTGTIYVDNSSLGTGTLTSTIYDPNNPIGIGGNGNDGYGPWDGIIDEVGLWSRALTADEVSELYNSGSGLTYPFTATSTFTPKVMFF